MGSLLKDVQSTDKGLVGITKDGGRILLNPVPILRTLELTTSFTHENIVMNSFPKRFNNEEEIKNMLEERYMHKKKEIINNLDYVLFGGRTQINLNNQAMKSNIVIQPYASYKEKE